MLQTNCANIFTEQTDLYRSIFRTRTQCHSLGTMDHSSKSRVSFHRNIDFYLFRRSEEKLVKSLLMKRCVFIVLYRPNRFSMTIQSLCTAIRSQLHFSQITAWSDLLKSSSPHDPELKSNPRIKATLKMPFKPKLDILYRILPYSDATSTSFSAPPIVHNFPETIISDHVSIKVSLKSLPRMKNIPRLFDSTDNVCADLVSDSPAPALIVNDRQEFDCQEKGKHRCKFDEESPTDEAISHRDKQLMKYKKRIMRRDKKKRNDELTHQKLGECSDMKQFHKPSMTHFR